LTELLPASQLVKANGWIEGLTIASIILGVVLGGQLVAPHVSGLLLGLDMPGVDLGITLAAQAAIFALVPVYVLAAAINLRIPLTGVAMRPMPRQLLVLLRDFRACNSRLWHDRLGQISLSTTTLFWGVSGNLRYIVLAWAGVALGYSTTQASALVGVVALGTAAGAVLASSHTQLDKATRVLPLGIAMGLVVILMNAIDNIWLAVPFLIVLGGLGGFLVVPMNALLQHRGHNLMGAGRSIAVQNFNEQAAILGMGVLYSLFTKWGLSAYGAIAAFGLLVAAVMVVILRWHVHNVRRYPKEMVQLRKIARLDQH
ncbi:MAG: lysophospholipid transporter LplT, partial [Alicycliphilus sp.]|nr:lysophospholipid transporter LplT [Alicycliphilus sp.]